MTGPMTRRRHRHRRPAPPAPVPVEDWVAIRAGPTDNASDNSLDEAKRLTHDGLIAELGPRRLSGVRWYIFDPPERDHVLDEMAAHGDPVTDMRAWFANHPTGRLVLATAKAIR
jgi:hypothetical protein